jgi:hypothetical protein
LKSKKQRPALLQQQIDTSIAIPGAFLTIPREAPAFLMRLDVNGFLRWVRA